MNHDFSVKSYIRQYSVRFESSFDFLGLLKRKDAFWVIDKNVFNLYKEQFGDIDADSLFLFEPSEDEKTIEGAIKVYKAMLGKSIRKKTRLISVGGGITQDVTGFIASTFYRGLIWIFLPTTLLAQADSCIGSKSSLNFEHYKNLIGTFYPPKGVFITPKFLPTLTKKDLYSGFGEIVKLQLMQTKKAKNLASLKEDFSAAIGGDEKIMSRLILSGLLFKKKFIEKDEFDTGDRRFLNYGHGFGHAFESVSNFAVPHGLSVVLGLIFAYIAAKRRGRLSEETFRSVVDDILLPNLHVDILDFKEEFFSLEPLFEAMKKDKKRVGKEMTLILPDNNFKLEIFNDFSYEELAEGIKELRKTIFQD